MNPNINRHRSPTQKNIPQPLPKTFNYLSYSPLTQRADKNDMHSSTEESTKEEQSSRGQHNFVKETDCISPLNSGFYKVKKQEANPGKNQVSPQVLKFHHSEKTINYKTDRKVESRQKVSPEKFNDYYGFKNVQPKPFKEKPRVENKLSDSGDSELSRNSGHSSNTEGKNFKFLAKKLDKQPLFKAQKQLARNQKHTPQFLQERNQKKLTLTSNNPNPPSTQLTPRKESPSHNLPHSPSKRQDFNGPGPELGIYKRSSLTPQNKLTLNRQNSYETNFGKNNYAPKKVSPFKNKDRELEREYNVSARKDAEKSYKLGTHYPAQYKEKKTFESKDFSFSKQVSPKVRPETQTNPRIPRTLLQLPVISVFPLSQQSIYPISFIQLEILAENNSSSIYKVLHPATEIIYCLKKSAVDELNRKQLIVEHKVSTCLIHPNLVRGFASFYDKKCLYLLMEYMDGRSLLNKIISQPQRSKHAQEKYEESMSSYLYSRNNKSDLKLNRLSFKEKPKFRQDMFSNPVQSNRSSNMHPHSQPQPQNLPPTQKLTYIRTVLQQILQGLRYLHENSIIHRDLKPDNIFMSHNNFKIGDFGSCTLTNSQQHIGTLDYAAPEIMLQQRYDRSIDIWSLGCLAYELDVGRPPFYHFQRSQTIRRIVNVQYDEERVSSVGLMRLIGKMLVRGGRISANQALMEVKMLEFQAEGVSTPAFRHRASGR